MEKPIILIAPASFKGTLSADEAAAVMRDFLSARLPSGLEMVRVCPIADGGDDTLAVLQAAEPDYQNHSLRVTGPLPGMKVEARYLVHPAKEIVWIEAAQAHGLKLLNGFPLAPLEATSFGVGELIRYVSETHHPKTLVVSLGGSASTDGGAGALQALGVQFTDETGNAIEQPMGGGALYRVCGVEWPGDWARFGWERLLIATDVVNPLLGADGAAAVFGPQKGANPRQCEQLEAGLQRLSQVLSTSLDPQSTDDPLTLFPGVGAAGGLAYGLRYLPRTGIVSGSQWIGNQLGLPELVEQSRIILTGEGCLDATSLGGKATGHLLAMAGDKPVFFFCGQARDGLTGWGQVSVYPMVRGECALDEPLEDRARAAALQMALNDPKAALRQLLERAWPQLEALISATGPAHASLPGDSCTG